MPCKVIEKVEARKIHGNMQKAHKSLLISWRRKDCYRESYVNGFFSFRTTASLPKENPCKSFGTSRFFRSAEMSQQRSMVTEVMDWDSVELES